MKRLAATLAACLTALALTAPPAQAEFGIFGFDVTFTDHDGNEATQAGAHPYAMTTSLGINFTEEGGQPFAEGRIKDIILKQMPGLVADATAYERCSSIDFLEDANCPHKSQVGVTASSSDLLGWRASPVYTLIPPPGALLRLGWNVADTANIVLDVGLTPEAPYVGYAASRNTPQTVDVLASKTELWGNPADSRHDELRGECLKEKSSEGVPLDDLEGFQFESTGDSCPLDEPNPRPFLTTPTNCSGALVTSFDVTSWEGERDTGADSTPPFTGCELLPALEPRIGAQPSATAADSATGLDFALEIDDEGLVSNEEGKLAKSHIRSVRVTLPPGMTANPSLAEGLGVCTEGQLAAETLLSGPGGGCPETAKIGRIEVQSPLVPEPVGGILYQAEPYANLAGDSLIAFYIVLKHPGLGILVKQAVRVEPDPRTGRLVAITEEIPQLPFSSFRLDFPSGERSALITPPTCGSHEVKAQITPWSGQPDSIATTSFQIASGPNGRPCPPGGAQPFSPGFEAGSKSRVAGVFSPFSMRLTRRDGDQDLTRFDATLPPGVLAKLAGVSQCSNAQIARAKAKTGREEIALPSCPANSRIGRVVSGAGVGSDLTYVGGVVYLGGPFAGAPLSAVAIVPAVAGPFDIGTVVVRQALQVNPVTGEVTADGAKSDPIPHILAGIPLRVKDIQVRVDRPRFTINPTSCDPMATRAQIWGGANPLSLADNAPAPRSAPYQAASCDRLGFKPKLRLRLNGGAKRGAHPSLRAFLTPRPGDANLKQTVVRLPRSAFLDQGHIRTICTRVQFAADNCPKGAIYGYVRAFSPLLVQPLEGPAYLRSSNNDLPDLVFDLRGIVDIEASARIDSIRGGIRATFAAVPDAPLTKVVVNMRGGKKGLIVNSRNLCRGKNRANVRLGAQNAKQLKLRPVVRARCGKKQPTR
jgi:hypothetical protein